MPRRHKNSKKGTTRSKLQRSIKKEQKRKKKRLEKKHSKLWDLEDGITYSALSLWLECREQFSLSYIDGLTPKRLSIPLEYGSLFHLCLEHQFSSGLLPVDVADKVIHKYREYRKGSLISSQERDTLELLLGLVRVTFPAYCGYWAKSDSKLLWIKREEKFLIDYKLPTESGFRDIKLRGMRDGIFRQDDLLGIFETKTKSKMPNDDDMRDSLKNDMQTMLYSFATYLETGEIPKRVLYNVVRRSTMYRRKEEPINSYLDRVEKDINERPEFYFSRWQINLTEDDMHNFVNNSLNPILNEFVRWYDSIKKNVKERSASPYHYQNYNALFGKYGRSQMFEATQGNLKPYNYREHAFPELSDCFQLD